MKVIIDTNFLLIPGTLGVDIFSQLYSIDPSAELCIIDRTIDELEKIKRKQKKFKQAAELALQLIKANKVKAIKTEKVKNVDQIIAEKAEKGYVVATQDKLLKKQLREKHIPVIILRQKKYLKLE
jgi:rRNA-processing protein FCF1